MSAPVVGCADYPNDCMHPWPHIDHTHDDIDFGEVVRCRVCGRITAKPARSSSSKGTNA